MSAYTMFVPGVHRSQKSRVRSLELELYIIISLNVDTWKPTPVLYRNESHLSLPSALRVLTVRCASGIASKSRAKHCWCNLCDNSDFYFS